VLKIRLAREIVESIRARYLKPLDLEFLTSLDRPLTRALYRLLDAQRVSPGGEEVMQFRTNIVEWAKACKIVDQTPSRVRRTLEGAHAELIERGYLSGVEYQGRGPKQAAIPEEATELVARLSRYGVARPAAHSLIGTYGLERVEERMARFEAILRAGYVPRNRAGFLVDVVRDDEGKYADPEGFVSHSRRLEADAAKAKRAEERKQQQADAEWEALDAKGRATKAIRMLTLILGKHVPTRYYSGLMEAFEASRLDPREVTEAAVRAQVELQLGPFAQELMRALDSLRGS